MSGGAYIEGNTLILGDSSYLEHHGIKGQRWGVRRFQNKDGSLTNAGRKRLGYSTKDVKTALVKGGKAVGGAAVTIGKAGYNLGKKAAAAGKAHSEKKKAEKLEKKKEKAAKTRLGVVRNADLFTAAEMAELNKKFKAKDEMTLASLQKGADYFRLAAGMVGSVASINKDFESITGKSLIPNPVKKEKEKREADERAEDRARKLAKEDAEEDRKRRADERKSKADEIDFKNKSEDLKNKQSEELRKQAAEARAQAKQTWDEDFAKEKTRAMKGTADENEAKAAVKKQELKTNEIAQREEAVAKREAAADESEERINYARKELLKRFDDADTYRDALIKATDMLRNAHDLTREQQDEVWAFIKKAQEDKLKHDDMDELYLEHHGIKGQRWGIRRFQNPDGTLTDKGRKHYQKKLDREERKQVSSDNLRGTLERRHGIAVSASGVLGAISGALTVAAVVSNPATIAAGAAISAAVSAGITHGSYSIAEAWEGRGSRIRKKRIAKYEDMLKQDAFVENNVLYLEHHGIKGQRWGIRRFQNPDGTRTPAGLKRDAKLAAKAEKYRNKDLARYDKEIANSIDPDRKYHYEQLRKHTAKLSDKQIIAQQRYSRAVAAGEGVVSTIALSILGIPNIGSIATGVFVANSISKTTRDNVRARTVIGERMRTRARNLEDALTQDAFVEDGVLYLAHHGILGQKWGVRRFQDAAGRLTAAGKKRLADVRRAVGEKGAKYKPSSSEIGTTATIPGYGASDDWDDTDDESLDELLQSLLALSDDQLKILGLSRKEIENAKTHDEKFKLALQFKKFDNPSTKVAKVLNSISSALFSSNLLDTLNPAKITGGALLAKLREQSAEHRKAREEVDPKTGFHIKENKDASKEDDVKSVNPGFTNLSDNTKNNCMLCTTAYDLRRRGYDVTADTISQGIMSTDVKRYYPDAEVRYITDATTTRELNDKTRDALISQGEGARGNLVINWQGGGAHSMAYEVHNGDVKIYDAQSGKTHDTWDMIQHGQDVIYARLDNVEPDWNRVKEAVH